MTEMLLPQSSVVPSPADFAAYLRSRQWQFGGIQANWALYTLDPENTAVEVPQLSQSRDYSRVAAALLEELSRIEHRAAAQILREVLASTTDVVRLALRGSTMNDGRIPVEAGLAAYDGARNLLLAAACSALDRRSAHARRKPDAAMKLLQRVRFGQTEVGSFVLTMESSVPPLLQGKLIELPDEEPPLERKTSLLLATALRATELALQEAAATGSIEPFRSRTPAGLSANLCDALVELIRDTQADQLTVSVSYAHHRPVPPVPWRGKLPCVPAGWRHRFSHKRQSCCGGHRHDPRRCRGFVTSGSSRPRCGQLLERHSGPRRSCPGHGWG